MSAPTPPALLHLIRTLPVRPLSALAAAHPTPLPTGLSSLDTLFSGGLPRGSIIALSGGLSSGAVPLALQCVPTTKHIVVHQSPPTARGVHVVTLEDECGLTNIIVRQDTYRAQREIWRKSPAIVVEGVVQRRGGATSLVAERVKPLAR